MRQHKRLIGACVLLSASLAFLGYRVLEYRRGRDERRALAGDPIVLRAAALSASGRHAEALSLLSLANRQHPENIPVALEYATALYTRRDYPAAEAAIQDLLQRAPALPQGLCLRGLIRRDSGRLPEGIADLEAALAARPEDVQFLQALAHALLIRSERELESTAAAEADLNRATELLQQAVDSAPDRPEILSDLALVQKRRRQWPAAVESYRRLAEMLPEAAHPLASASQCSLYSGDAPQAVAMARAALEREPHYASAHEQLARALRTLPAESVDADEYRRALRSWWDESGAASPLPALWLAQAYLQEENTEAAEAALREAIEDEEARRHVPNPEIHAELGRLLRDTGRKQEAAAELATARRLHQQWDPIGDLMNRITFRPAHSRDERLAVARLYHSLGWPEKGLPQLEPLLNADPPDAEAERLARELEHATP